MRHPRQTLRGDVASAPALNTTGSPAMLLQRAPWQLESTGPWCVTNALEAGFWDFPMLRPALLHLAVNPHSPPCDAEWCNGPAGPSAQYQNVELSASSTSSGSSLRPCDYTEPPLSSRASSSSSFYITVATPLHCTTAIKPHHHLRLEDHFCHLTFQVFPSVNLHSPFTHHGRRL